MSIKETTEKGPENENNEHSKSGKVSDDVSSSLVSSLDDGENENYEKYFQDNLEASEFEELKTLVEDSNGMISWEALSKEEVVRINRGEIEGIYWKGDLDLRDTSIKSLGKIKSIFGNLNCDGLKSLEDLGELELVFGNLFLQYTNIRSLGELEEVTRSLDCTGIESLEDLGKLKKVGMYLILCQTNIRSLGRLEVVGGSLDCGKIYTLEDLGSLEFVGGNLILHRTRIKTFGGLKKVWGTLYCEGVKTLEDWGDLKIEEKYANIDGTKLSPL